MQPTGKDQDLVLWAANKLASTSVVKSCISGIANPNWNLCGYWRFVGVEAPVAGVRCQGFAIPSTSRSIYRQLPEIAPGEIDPVMGRVLLLWNEQYDTPDTMPTKAQLCASRRGDIAGGIRNYHSGIKAVTAALGLKLGSKPPAVKPIAYWLEWENVLANMSAVSKACGMPRQMPTQDQLFANGYSTLANAISKHYSAHASTSGHLQNFD